MALFSFTDFQLQLHKKRPVCTLHWHGSRDYFVRFPLQFPLTTTNGTSVTLFSAVEFQKVALKLTRGIRETLLTLCRSYLNPELKRNSAFLI